MSYPGWYSGLESAQSGQSVELEQPADWASQGYPTLPSLDRWETLAEWKSPKDETFPVTVSVDVAVTHRNVAPPPFFPISDTQWAVPPLQPALFCGAFLIPFNPLTSFGCGWDGMLQVEYGNSGSPQQLWCDVKAGAFTLPASNFVRVSVQRYNMQPIGYVVEEETVPFPKPQSPYRPPNGSERPAESLRVSASLSPAGAYTPASGANSPTWTVVHCPLLNPVSALYVCPPRARRLRAMAWPDLTGADAARPSGVEPGNRSLFNDLPLFGLPIPVAAGGVGNDRSLDVGQGALGGLIEMPQEGGAYQIHRWELSP